MAKVLMKGAEAIAEAAIEAGCQAYFGYPITPQNEVPEYFAKRMPQVGRVFLQAESELASINMVYGAASAGARVMTSSSSPGIALMQEGISYLVGARLPCVVVNFMRGGPGLGGIQPSQADYFQATRGGGNGDYYLIVYAPATLQEMCDMTKEAFDTAEQYRLPVMILADGMLGQMMEPVELGGYTPRPKADMSWAATGWQGDRPRSVINSLYIQPEELEEKCETLFETYEVIRKQEKRWENYHTEGADIIIGAYGTMARIVKSVIAQIDAEGGPKVGLIRPLTLWPFPEEAFAEAAEQESVKAFISVEMSKGQMIDDIRISLAGKKPVSFFGRTGGVVPTAKEVHDYILQVYHQSLS